MAPKRGTKRGIDGSQEEGSSPLRRSKRYISEAGLGPTSPPATAAGNGHETGPVSEREEEGDQERRDDEKDQGSKAAKSGRAGSVKLRTKERTTRTRTSRADQNEEEQLDGEEEKQEEEQEEEITIKKVTRKTKTKKEEEDEVEDMPPLAARTPGLRMFVGAHVSAAKGVHNAVTNSVHIGGNAFALFLKSQRKWDNPPLQDEHRDRFRQFCLEHKYDATKHVLPHGSYLVNLAQEDKAKAKQAYDSFLDDLRRCEQLGITLYNFHPGSANETSLSSAISRLANALTNALAATSTVIPVLETMCGHGTTIGGKLSDFRDLLALVPEKYHDRIGICIDTCHCFAAGYDLVSPEGFQSFMKEFEEVIGLKYLRALHLNDSKAPRGSKRDLHANIGTGFLGLRAFHNVMNEKRFEGLPMILETPIDRPDPSFKATSTKPAKGNKKPPMIEDKSVWAHEIKLLESLIGMDPESAEFRALEAQLAEEGRAEREKYQAQYERKLEAEEKKRKKALEREKGQVTLDAMIVKKTTTKTMKTTSTRKKKAKDDDDAEESSSGVSEGEEGSE